MPKKSQRKKLKKSITKIVSSKKNADESFNVDIINNKDPQVQLHKSKELTKDFLIGELNKKHGIKINISIIIINITFMKQIKKENVGFNPQGSFAITFQYSCPLMPFRF